MTDWSNPGTPGVRSDASSAALTYIRSMLADAGHPVHGPDYWSDRGIRITAMSDGVAVAWCVWCYQAAQRGGMGNAEAQEEGWRARGFRSVCEEAAVEHWQGTHAGAVGMA